MVIVRREQTRTDHIPVSMIPRARRIALAAVDPLMIVPVFAGAQNIVACGEGHGDDRLGLFCQGFKLSQQRRDPTFLAVVLRGGMALRQLGALRGHFTVVRKTDKKSASAIDTPILDGFATVRAITGMRRHDFRDLPARDMPACQDATV